MPAMTVTTWILTEETPQEDGAVALVLTGMEGAHPRVRYALDDDGLHAGLATASPEASMATGAEALTPIPRSPTTDLRLVAPSGRTVPPMPSAASSEALDRLQRGAAAVWEDTAVRTEVRGLLDIDVTEDTAVVLPLLRHSARRIVVTEDDRLLVLDEHASQPRATDGLPTSLPEAALHLYTRPATVHTSRIRVHDSDAVRCGYVDGGWHVVATSTEGRLSLTLPLAFPAERFGDA